MPTAGELRTELKARNFNDTTLWSDARLLTFINDAVTAINEGGDVFPGAAWIWLDTTVTGTAPLTVSDVREVLYVHDTTNDCVLQHLDSRSVGEVAATDLALTGTPQYWYWTSETQLSVYPANTSVSLSVRYIKVPATLTATDTPSIPARYHSLIVDQAEVYCLEAAHDEEHAAAKQARVDKRLYRLGNAMLRRSNDTTQVLTGSLLVDW